MSEQSMIERMARAMKPSHFAILDKGDPGTARYFEAASFRNAIKVCKRARKDAAAALAAMRKPSLCIIRAADRHNANQSVAEFRQQWSDMIDAALAEHHSTLKARKTGGAA